MLRKVKWNVVYKYQLYRYSIILKRKQKKKCFNIVFLQLLLQHGNMIIYIIYW